MYCFVSLHRSFCDAGALKSLDELTEERGNLEKAFRWEWDNDDILKGRPPSGVNPNLAFREGLKRYGSCTCVPLCSWAMHHLIHSSNKHMKHVT